MKLQRSLLGFIRFLFPSSDTRRVDPLDETAQRIFSWEVGGGGGESSLTLFDSRIIALERDERAWARRVFLLLFFLVFLVSSFYFFLFSLTSILLRCAVSVRVGATTFGLIILVNEKKK